MFSGLDNRILCFFQLRCNLDLSNNIVSITIKAVGISLNGVRHHTSNIGDRVEIKVTAKHGQLSDVIQETIKTKVAKLPKFFDRMTAIQVLADLKRSDSPKVEIIVSAEQTNDFFASDTGNNVIVALDSTISKIEQQIKKHKEKLVSHRGRDQKVSEESAE